MTSKKSKILLQRYNILRVVGGVGKISEKRDDFPFSNSAHPVNQENPGSDVYIFSIRSSLIKFIFVPFGGVVYDVIGNSMIIGH
jgi:hypothetical protein